MATRAHWRPDNRSSMDRRAVGLHTFSIWCDQLQGLLWRACGDTGLSGVDIFQLGDRAARCGVCGSTSAWTVSSYEICDRPRLRTTRGHLDAYEDRPANDGTW